MFTEYFKSPIGNFKIVSNGEQLISIKFCSKVGKNHGDKLTVKAKKQLNEYFSKKRKKFDLPLDINSSKFSKRVYLALLKVPFGKTITYGELARKAGSKGAARAVGTCMNKNNFTIVVPCHRVLGTTNKYFYGGGSTKKKWLLKHES